MSPPTTLPAPDTPPRVFLEEWLPQAFEQAALPEEAQAFSVEVGVRLLGEGGGDWVLRFERGSLRAAPGAVETAALSLIQRIEDWRGCLWEGRGGFFGEQAARLFHPAAAAEAVREPRSGGLGRAFDPGLAGRLQGLQGLVRLVTAEEAGSDWCVDLKLGPGPVPEAPTATVSLPAEAAAALARGELDPLQAFLSGRLRISGDIGFLMRMQALQGHRGG